MRAATRKANGHRVIHHAGTKARPTTLTKLNRKLGKAYTRSLRTVTRTVTRKPYISLGTAAAVVSTLSGLAIWYSFKK